MRLAVVTPSYAPDYEFVRDLHRSVLDHSDASVVHYVVIPESDRALFSSLAGPRCVVWSVKDVLPSRFLALPRTNIWLNSHRLYPPVRGWVIQQLLKLAVASMIDAEVLVLMDSDTLLIRPVGAAHFVRDGAVRLYRQDGAIDDRLPRHLTWHRGARQLLGLPQAQAPLHDYVSTFIAWDRRLVLALHDRIRDATGRDWIDALGTQLHLSECTLYGVFVDEVIGSPANSYRSDLTHCHNYWDEIPLDLDSATAFVTSAQPTDLAIMLSAKSRTPVEVRRAALATLAAGG